MRKELTLRQTAFAFAVGLFGVMSVFYTVMVMDGQKHDLVEWLLPSGLFVMIFILAPVAAILVQSLGQLLVLPFLAVWGLTQWIKKKRKSSNQPSQPLAGKPGSG